MAQPACTSTATPAGCLSGGDLIRKHFVAPGAFRFLCCLIDSAVDPPMTGWAARRLTPRQPQAAGTLGTPGPALGRGPRPIKLGAARAAPNPLGTIDRRAGLIRRRFFPIDRSDTAGPVGWVGLWGLVTRRVHTPTSDPIGWQSPAAWLTTQRNLPEGLVSMRST